MVQPELNARQLEVLQWIAEGCPDGVWRDDAHKVSAAALRNRKLVTVSGHGPTWHAQLTDAGHYFIEQGDYPDDHWYVPDSLKAPATPQSQAKKTQPGRPALHRTPAVVTVSPTEKLLADISAAGGRLQVERRADQYWESLVASAMRGDRIDNDKILTIERGATNRTITLVLIDAPNWVCSRDTKVRVSSALRKPHAAIVSLRDDPGALPFAPSTRNRGLRILNALATTVEHRGGLASVPKSTRGYATSTAVLGLEVLGHEHTVHMKELNDRARHKPTAEELQDSKRHRGAIPTYDYFPSGRLQVQITPGPIVQQDIFSDNTRATLEQQLPRVLRELDLRAALNDERTRQGELEAQLRRERWEEVHRQAQADALDAHRSQVLLQRASDWEQVTAIREYLDEADVRADALKGRERKAAREWVDWGRQYVDSLDPFASERLAMPTDPEVTPDMLEPYMQGLSPYGPDY